MRKFLHSPLFRCLICLILISCILVNCSPIRADAFAAGAAVTAIVGAAAAASVVAGVMVALGVMPDSTNTGAFNTVVNECVDALTASGAIVGGMITLLQLSDGVVTKNHVNQGIVEAILDWLFESGNVNIDKSVAPSGSAYFGDYLLPDFSSIPNYSSNSKAIIVNAESVPQLYLFTEDSQMRALKSNTGEMCVYAWNPCGYSFFTVSDGVWKHSYDYHFQDATLMFTVSQISWSSFDICYNTPTSGNIVVSGSGFNSTLIDTTIATGLIAGQIGTDIETDYETWVQDGVVAVDFGIGYVDDPNTENDDDDDDEGDTEIGPSNPKDPVTPENPAQPSTAPSPWWKNNKWLNVGGGIAGAALGELTYQLLNQTQNGIQTGTGDPAQKVDTSLFANNGNGTNNWLDPNPSVPEPTIPVVPPVSSDIAGYTFDLKDIFPFCIPFDIYNFLKCLDAPPEAPVINWELYVPGGGAYPLIIDLSVFDEVAQLLRRLELLLFCVGLAFKTRDLIKG